MDTEYYSQYPPGMKMTDGVPEDVRTYSFQWGTTMIHSYDLKALYFSKAKDLQYSLGDGSSQFSLEPVRPSEPSDSPFLWSHLLLSLGHVLPWQWMRYLHLPEDEKPQDTCENNSKINI